MKLNDKIYDILKWIDLILIPALTTAYVGLSAVWGWPLAEQVAKTSAVVCVLLGTILGISTAEYRKEDKTIISCNVQGNAQLIADILNADAKGDPYKG